MINLHDYPDLVEQVNDKTVLLNSLPGTLKLEWRCNLNHLFIARLSDRISKGSGCPYCSNHKTWVGYNDLLTLYPLLATEWSYNNPISVQDARPGMSKKFLWVCSEGHEWESAPKTRVQMKTKCPVCSSREIRAGINDLATTHPEIAVTWHPTKNSFPVTSISYGAKQKVWWKCKLNHEWSAPVKVRVKQGCSICSGKQVMVGVNDLATTHPKLILELHPTKNEKDVALSVSAGSHKKVHWVCKNNHEWATSVKSRALSGRNCPVCANKQLLTGYNSFDVLYPNLAKEWHPTKNILAPSEIIAASGKRAWWQCSKKHEWQTKISDRVFLGIGCPECAAKRYVSLAEKEIHDWLLSLGVDALGTVRNVIKGELDIYIPSKNLAIEYNGLYWHTDNWGNKKTSHYEKWKACKEKGIQLIQIWEDDWNSNPELVKNMLAHKLGVSQQRKVSGHKTEVIELTNEQSAVFLNANHIQGAVSGGVRLGLVEKGNPDTVLAVMVLKSEPGSGGKVLNLLRFATSVTVVGGFTKLLKYAERNFKPDSIITFSDNCVSDGGLYRNNGFVAVKELEPDYKYVVKGERVHKFRYRLKRFKEDPNLQYEEGLSERELALLNRIPRIWDAGKTKWEKKIVSSD